MDKIVKMLNKYKLNGIEISTSNPSLKIKTYQKDVAIDLNYMEDVKDTFYYANGFLNMFYSDQNLLEFFINRPLRIEEGWEKFSKKLVEEYEKVRKIGHSGSLEDFNKYILERPDGDEYFIGKNVKLKKYIKEEEKNTADVYIRARGIDMPKMDDVKNVLVGMEKNGVYFEDIQLKWEDVTFSICDLDKYNFWHGGRGFDFQIPKSTKNRIFSVSSFGLDVKDSVSLVYEVYNSLN